MFKLRTAFILTAFALPLALSACQPDRLGTANQAVDKASPYKTSSLAKAQPAGEMGAPLATVDGQIISLGDFQNQLNQQSPYVRARYTSLEQKKDFLDNLIKFELLAKEAQKRGFDNDPEVIRSMKQVMIQKLLQDEFEKKLTPASITDEEVKAFYDANITEYVKPAEVRASAIVVATKDLAVRIATEAAGEAGRTNKAFRDLVGKYSDDADTKLRGGDLRYFAADNTELPAPLVAAAFALANVGDVSGPIDGGNGKFYVIKQTGTRRAFTKSLDEASSTIRNKLFRDKRIAAQTAFVSGLRGAAKITVNEANLSKVRIDTSMSNPGADPHAGMGEPSMVTGRPGQLDAPEPEPDITPGPQPSAPVIPAPTTP